MREKGANQQISERRLFMQLQVWTGCPDGKPLVAAMERSRIEGVLYHDVNDPARRGRCWPSHEDPAFFATHAPRGSSPPSRSSRSGIAPS